MGGRFLQNFQGPGNFPGAPQLQVSPGIPQAGIAAQSGFQPAPIGAQPVSQASGFQQTGPATGLLGATQSLGQGALGATQAQLEAAAISRGDITGGGQRALGQIQGGQNLISQGFGQAGQTIGQTAGAAQGLVGQGIQQGIGQIQQGGAGAQRFLTGAGQQAQGQIQQGVGAIQQGAQGGLGLLNQGVGAISGGAQAGFGALNQRFDQGIDPISGFIGQGQGAQDLLSSRLGLGTPEQQAAAFQNFQSSPGQQFLLEQGRREALANAAATGGVGGGRVRTELQRRAIGLAAQDLGRQDQLLAGLSQQGLSAAGTAGQLRGQQGLAGADLLSGAGRDIAGLRQAGAGLLAGAGRDIGGLQQAGAGLTANLGAQQADVSRGTSQDTANLLRTGAITQAEIATNAGQQIAQLESSGALAGADLATRSAMIEQATGQNLAQIAQSTGANISQIVENLGSANAGLRSQAGRDLANAIAQSSTQLANLQASQGSGISDIVGGAVSNIGNLLVNAGVTDAASQENQATILANIAVGSGSQSANIAQNVGNINAAGVLGQNSAIQTALGSLADAAGDSNFLSNLLGSSQSATLRAGAAGAFGTPTSN